jgi:hypothetical protein
MEWQTVTSLHSNFYVIYNFAPQNSTRPLLTSGRARHRTQVSTLHKRTVGLVPRSFL